MRRLPSIKALVPALYLKGISTGDMQEALESILGENAKGLSATRISDLRLAGQFRTLRIRPLVQISQTAKKLIVFKHLLLINIKQIKLI